MARNTPLLNTDHAELRVITTRSAALGDAVMHSLTYPAEFRALQAHYPIVFRRTADAAGYECLALFGFQEGENLFLNEDGWDAHVLPQAIERLPFLIGRAGEAISIHVDLDSPRVSNSIGEFAFRPYGGNTEYLDRISDMLGNLHHGLQTVPEFFAALQALELIEPFVLDVTLDDGSENRLMGFHTINEERLGELGAEALGGLHAAGFLEAIFMVLASMNRFRDLIERKRLRNA
jgi:hypothetical protein